MGGGGVRGSGNIVGMAVLVDEAVWPWRGARWAHLVSDESVDELHAFAHRLGLRRMAFQGDHYDVPADVRERALSLGAEAVRGRELVRRLRASGLRLAAADRPGSWEEVWRWPASGARPDVVVEAPGVLVEALGEALAGVDARWETAEVLAFRRLVSQRSDEVVIVVQDDGGVVFSRSIPDGVEVRCHDDRIIELMASRSVVTP